MNRADAPPAEFKDLVDLSADALGGFVLFATDDYFAEKENLLRPHAAEWVEGKYTDKGKWMDGWESQRKREPGHDFAIVRLGVPGSLNGVLVDTTHFKGNAPQEIALEGIVASQTATPAQLLASEAWFPLLPRVSVKPDFQNVLPLKTPSARVTHVRFHIFPDGGVARLRLYGVALPEPRAFWRVGSIDLAAVENGGTVVEVSNAFFGPASNLLLPGRGVNMGDGWETKRRRTPGSDWAVIRLARRGLIDRIELDTHFFKGNAPQATLIEAVDEEAIGAEAVKGLLRAPKGWQTLVGRTPLVQHRRHQLEPSRTMPVTHVRIHIYPHGGVNRLRLIGVALNTPFEREALNRLNELNEAQVRSLMLSFCGSPQFVELMMHHKPFTSVRELFAAAEDTWWSLDVKHWLEAFAAHPRIGDKKKAKKQTAKSAKWSSVEQKAVAVASREVTRKLAELNAEYFRKFGFIFIVFASGKPADEMLALLADRLHNPKYVELENAAVEQAKITRLRIEKWLETP